MSKTVFNRVQLNYMQHHFLNVI